MVKTVKQHNPFIVIDNGLRLSIAPFSGWYAVQSLDIRGLNTQGKTIEEAINMAHDAAAALAEAEWRQSRKRRKAYRNITKTPPQSPSAPNSSR